MRILGAGLACYLRFVLRTARIQIHFEGALPEYLDGRAGAFILHWHGRLALSVLFGMIAGSGRFHADWPYALKPVGLVKPRAEGLLFKQCLMRLSIPTLDSDHGGVRRIADLTGEGCSVVTPADGPRGPECRVNPAVVRLALRSGALMVPVGCAASLAVRFPSWDRFVLPLPFTRLVYVWGNPLPTPEGFGPNPVQRGCQDLERRLTALTRNAELLRHRSSSTGSAA